MNERSFDGLLERINASYGESSEVNAKLDFAKSMLEREKSTQKLIVKYIESVLQIAEACQRCYVKVGPGNCSGAFSTIDFLHVEEGKNE